MDENLEKQEQIQETPEKQEQPQTSEIEQRALEMGWRPREEFDGSDDDFIDAKEFVRRKPLFDRIDQQGRQLKNVTKALEEFKQHYTKVREVEFNRALNALKAERKQALTEGDGEKFEAIDEQIKDVEAQAERIKEMHEAPLVKEEPVQAPEFVAWKARNSWYDNTSYMRKFADEVGIKFHQQGMTPSEVLRKVEEAVKKEFPTKFRNPNKDNAPHLEGSGSNQGSRKSDNFQLTDVERKVMNDLVRQGVMTKDEYISDLKKIKGVA